LSISITIDSAAVRYTYQHDSQIQNQVSQSVKQRATVILRRQLQCATFTH